jgi:hypothetical protein
MKRLTLLSPVFAVALLAAPAALACSPAQQENLLTGVLFREAHPNRAHQAAVASIVFNRMASPTYKGSLCKVVTARGQFKYRIDRNDPLKLGIARANAQLFLREHAAHGRIVSEAGIAQRLRGLDSFKTSSTSVGGRERDRVHIGGNTFYMSKAARKSAALRGSR